MRIEIVVSAEWSDGVGSRSIISTSCLHLRLGHLSTDPSVFANNDPKRGKSMRSKIVVSAEWSDGTGSRSIISSATPGPGP